MLFFEKLFQNIGWNIYRFKFRPSVLSNLSILMSFHFVTNFSILFPLNVINWFTLEQRWNLLGQRETTPWPQFCQEKSFFRMKLIFILVGRLIIKIAMFRAQKTHMWSEKPIIIGLFFFVPTLHDIDVNIVWFQQGGATCYNRFIASSVWWPFNLSKYTHIHT